MSSRRWFILLAVLASAVQVAAYSSAAWSHYVNARYGFAVDYPTRLRPAPGPDNGDGRIFKGQDGVQLTAYGANNVSNESVAGDLGVDLDAHAGHVTYQAHGATWFVASWTEGTDIVYHKQFVGKGCVNGVLLRYPKRLATVCAPMVTRVERSFTPGDLRTPH